jgi:hypothetical protein
MMTSESPRGSSLERHRRVPACVKRFNPSHMPKPRIWLHTAAYAHAHFDFGYMVGYMKRLRADLGDRPGGVSWLPNAGAGDGTRTRKGLPPAVFKTAAFAISPLRRARAETVSLLFYQGPQSYSNSQKG